MGRQNQRGLELTFHGPSGRWRKRVGGRDFFFGSGKGVSDRASYRAALVRYRAWADDREKGHALDILARATLAGKASNIGDLLTILASILTATGQNLSTATGEQSAAAANQILAERIAAGDIKPRTPANYATLPPALVDLVNQRASMMAGAITATGATIQPHPEDSVAAPAETGADATTPADKLLDRYQAELHRRYKQTVNAPQSLSPKDRMGGSALRTQVFSLRLFREHLRASKVTDFNDAHAIERALTSFRAGIDAKVAAGQAKAGGIESRLKALRPFFGWAWRAREIADLPRNLTLACAKTPRQSTAHPLSVEDVRKLWAAANSEMRCFVALGLNCGYYAIDVATLEPGHLTDAPGYIARNRHKTSIPHKIKLWPLTEDLIARHRTKNNLNLAFTRTFMGQQLPWVIERAAGKYDAIGREFAKVAKAAGVKATWSQLRDTSAHHIERAGLNGDGVTDPELVSQFLGHADSRMAKLYLGTKPAELERTKLDKAIMGLLDTYGLTGDPKLAISA